MLCITFLSNYKLKISVITEEENNIIKYLYQYIILNYVFKIIIKLGYIYNNLSSLKIISHNYYSFLNFIFVCDRMVIYGGGGNFKKRFSDLFVYDDETHFWQQIFPKGE